MNFFDPAMLEKILLLVRSFLSQKVKLFPRCVKLGLGYCICDGLYSKLCKEIKLKYNFPNVSKMHATQF